MSILRTFSPNFLKLIDASSAKIFGKLPQVNHRTGYNIFRQKLIGPAIIDYYPMGLDKGLQSISKTYKSEEIDRLEFALSRLKRRGKGPPKKGQGKRTTKNKGKKK